MKDAFGLQHKDIIVQIYNEEWQDFIDVDDDKQITDRAKLRIITQEQL